MPIQSRDTRIPSFLAALAVLFLAATLAFADVEFIQVPSEIMKREIPASVTVPNDYATSKARLPVVYLLHGAGDDERGWGANTCSGNG